MKKSTVIAYLELQRKYEGLVSKKIQAMKKINEQLDLATEDEEFEPLEKDLHFNANEKAVLNEEIEKIHRKLMEARKGENGEQVRKWMKEYEEENPQISEKVLTKTKDGYEFISRNQ